MQLEQGGADVADPGQQTVELSLVRHRSGKRRRTVVASSEDNVAQPG